MDCSKLIADAMEKVGNDGVITIEESKGIDAISLVFEATSATSLAPIFSKWSSNSIALAIVTPAGAQVEFEGQEYLVMHEKDILAVVE